MLEFDYDQKTNTYIISDDISLDYGVGDSWVEAFYDYIVSLIEHMQILRNRRNKNG